MVMRLFVTFSVSLAAAGQLSNLKLDHVAKLKLGLSNLDVEDDMFGAGAGEQLFEAEVYEDWVTTDSRRMLQGVAAGSAWVDPGEIDTSYVPDTKAAAPSTAAAPTAAPAVVEPEPVVMIGGAQDEGGCLTSAGFSWCGSKSKCLRIWEEDCEAAMEEPAVEYPEAPASWAGSAAGMHGVGGGDSMAWFGSSAGMASMPMPSHAEKPAMPSMPHTEKPAMPSMPSAWAGSAVGMPSSDSDSDYGDSAQPSAWAGSSMGMSEPSLPSSKPVGFEAGSGDQMGFDGTGDEN